MESGENPGDSGAGASSVGYYRHYCSCEIIGKIKPVFINGIWTYTEEIYEQSNMKEYPEDTWEHDAYINNTDKTIFLAYSNIGCVGHIVLKKDWNGLKVLI